jgi:nuclear pore complex protein Nup133
MHPRLQAVTKGALIAIQFGDAVALCARGLSFSVMLEWLLIPTPETEYIDRLELKSATDRTLGVGVLGSEGELLILTAATMIKVYVDMDQIAKFDRE